MRNLIPTSQHYTVNIIAFIHGYTILPVGKMVLFYYYVCSQYHFVLSLIQFMYSALKTSSPAVLVCPYHTVSYWSVYASEKRLITYWPIIVVHVVFISTYLPVCTNADMFPLMTSSTTWLILSISSLDFSLSENWMMFQLLKEPNTGQYVQFLKGW